MFFTLTAVPDLFLFSGCLKSPIIGTVLPYFRTVLTYEGSDLCSLLPVASS